jgi:hypothetical protein
VLPGIGLFQGRHRVAHFHTFPIWTEQFLSNCNYVRLSYSEWNPGSSKHCLFPVFQLGRCVSSMSCSKHSDTRFCDTHTGFVTPVRQSYVQEDSEICLLNSSVVSGHTENCLKYIDLQVGKCEFVNFCMFLSQKCNSGTYRSDSCWRGLITASLSLVFNP